jgi:hypothetical protein
MRGVAVHDREVGFNRILVPLLGNSFNLKRPTLKMCKAELLFGVPQSLPALTRLVLSVNSVLT